MDSFCFSDEDPPPDSSHQGYLFLACSFTPGIYTTWGKKTK